MKRAGPRGWEPGLAVTSGWWSPTPLPWSPVAERVQLQMAGLWGRQGRPALDCNCQTTAATDVHTSVLRLTGFPVPRVTRCLGPLLGKGAECERDSSHRAHFADMPPSRLGFQTSPPKSSEDQQVPMPSRLPRGARLIPATQRGPVCSAPAWSWAGDPNLCGGLRVLPAAESLGLGEVVCGGPRGTDGGPLWGLPYPE